MKRRSKTFPRGLENRRGAVLVCVMVCLLIASALLASLMKTAVRARRQARLSMHAAQVDWLIDAGWSRATARLQADATYDGETWHPHDQAFLADRAAEVQIRIRPGDDREIALVDVAAEYPSGAVDSVRRSQTFAVPLNQPAGPD